MATLKALKKQAAFPASLSDFFDYDRVPAVKLLRGETAVNIPAVNVREKNKEFEIEFAAPGYNKSDFKVHVDGDVLTVSAERREEKTADKKRYTRREFSYSSFSRSFTLPKTATAAKVDAKYNDGILKLSIPKKQAAAAAQKKDIRVR